MLSCRDPIRPKIVKSIVIFTGDQRELVVQEHHDRIGGGVDELSDDEEQCSVDVLDAASVVVSLKDSGVLGGLTTSDAPSNTKDQ